MQIGRTWRRGEPIGFQPCRKCRRCREKGRVPAPWQGPQSPAARTGLAVEIRRTWRRFLDRIYRINRIGLGKGGKGGRVLTQRYNVERAFPKRWERTRSLTTGWTEYDLQTCQHARLRREAPRARWHVHKSFRRCKRSSYMIQYDWCAWATVAAQKHRKTGESK